jgi:hypothetical protein
MTATLTTILISALTSGVVALGLEWLVKPRLEARKAILLDLHRKRHMFMRNMMVILTEISKWSDYEDPKGIREPVRQRLNDDRRKALRRVDEAIQAMNDDVTDLALSHPTRHNKNLIAGYIFAVYVLNMSNRNSAEKWRKIQELTELAYNWRSARFWKFRTRMTPMLKLIALLKEYSAD